METTAPMIGIPAATNPPKTTTMSAKDRGRAIPSPRRRSASIWPTISSPRAAPLPIAMLAPGSVPPIRVYAARTATSARSCAAPSRPASRRVTMRKALGGVDPAATNAAARGSAIPAGNPNGLATSATPSMAAMSAVAAAAAVATAGLTRSTPSTVSRIAGRSGSAAASRSRPVVASPGAVGSPVDSLLNRDGPPTPAAATRKAATARTAQVSTTRHGWSAVEAPQRDSPGCRWVR